jgi:Family of unknown function (DUF6328)
VQVLFAFLLAVPFTNGLNRVTELQRDVFFVAFLCALASSVLLIAPSAYHRLRWRDGDKERMLTVANQLAIAQPGRLLDSVAAAAIVVGRRCGRTAVRAGSVVAGGPAVVVAVEVGPVCFRPCLREGGLGLTARVGVGAVVARFVVTLVGTPIVTLVGTLPVTLVMSVSVIPVPVVSPGAAPVSPASAKPPAARPTAAPAARKRRLSAREPTQGLSPAAGPPNRHRSMSSSCDG